MLPGSDAAKQAINDLISDDFNRTKAAEALSDVANELANAQRRFPSFNTAHEGYAVLLEEVDELWTEVKKKQGLSGRPEAIRKEAVQVAAMAIRLILDTADPSKTAYNK